MPEQLPANVRLGLLPPAEAVAWFRARNLLAPAFSWQDVWQEEHNRAFTVAKMMREDLLVATYAALDRALTEGTGLAEFERQIRPVLEAAGWWGEREMVDPATGARRVVQLGSPRRLKTIFETNTRTAYAAGRWKRIERGRRVNPFIVYRTMRDERVRLTHRRWDGVALPIDHPFWDTRYPPNGWACRCSAYAIDERGLQRLADSGLKITREAPGDETLEFVNRRSGEVTRVPAGVDPGFAYNPGKLAWRGVSPPPVDALPSGRLAFGGPATDAMPPARPASRDRLLPAGLPAAEYESAFLRAFGATVGAAALFTDVLGNVLPISAALFRDSSGESKTLKRGRERHVLLLADALREPDEVWLTPTWVDGRLSLRYRYLARAVLPAVEGDDLDRSDAFTVFELSREGWTGVTTFPAERPDYLPEQRVGLRLYRRGGNG